VAPAVADQRILQGVTANLQVTLRDQEGTAADAAGVLTVRVQDSADADILAAGTATTQGTSGDGIYTRALTAAQTASLDLLTATWTDAGDGSTHVTRHEIVGGYYFSLADVRAHDEGLTAENYADAVVLAARRDVEEEAEAICGCAFVPRFAQVQVTGTGRNRLLLPPYVRSVRAVTVHVPGWTTEILSEEQLADLEVDSADCLVRPGAIWPTGALITVSLEHGLDRPPPDLRTAALTRLRHRLNASASGIPDRAESFTAGEGGTFRLATAGKRRTGIPDVDAVYQRYSARWTKA
jgi:hypothetical protein